MRFTSPYGLLARAACSVAVNALVLVASLVVAGFFAATFVFQLSNALSTRYLLLALLAAGAIGGALTLGRGVPRAIRAERRQLLDNTYAVDELALEGADELEDTARRLALQADVTVPAVRVHTAWTPLAYTTYRPDDPLVRTGSAEPVLVVSRGVVDRLSADRREAVLAHEIAHLANDDLRLLSWLLVPLFAAESLGEEDADDGFGSDDDRSDDEPSGGVLASLAAVGLGVFTRGREIVADRDAAAITGDPSALAAALERLDETRVDRPEDDLRRHAQSTNAVNVLPSVGAEHDRSWLASTHPPLEARLEQLHELANEDGDDGGS